MNGKIQILLGCMAAVTASFLQTPNQFQTTFNSTFLTGNHRIFKPIVILNDTKLLDHSKTKIYETERKKPEEKHNESFQESPPKEDEQPKDLNYPLKYSSRYSTKLEESQSENKEKTVDDQSRISEQSDTPSQSENIPVKDKSFYDRSDNYDYSEEKENRYTDREEEGEERVEPQSEEKYTDKTSEEVEEEEEESEKKEVDERRSAEDYYASDPENNISIQTPLNEIQYRGPQSFRNDFASGKPRERLISPIQRHHIKHNWPYSKSQLKAEFKDSNEIPENLDEKIHREVKNPKALESAVKKDEEKLDLNKKYNVVEERNRRIKQQKSLAAEEAKDDSRPLFPYQVIEKFQISSKDQKKPNIFSNFEDGDLGPVVFNPNTNERKSRLNKKPLRSPYLKGLLDNEKLDQDRLTNSRWQKSAIESGTRSIKSFNHLEESDELYSAILANIQSVFGIRTQPLKSEKGTEVDTEESKFFTWSLPLRKKGKEKEEQRNVKSDNEVKGLK